MLFHAPECAEGSEALQILLRFFCYGCDMNENHPVLIALETRLQALKDQYSQEPNEQSRYALVRHEQLLAQWAPQSLLAS